MKKIILNLPYNKSMARPTKKNDELKLKLADFIRSGLTVKDTCEATGVSTSTFNRWRNSDIEFDRLINEATKRGWENAEAFAKYHYRGYKRKVAYDRILPAPEKPLTEPPMSLKRQNNMANDKPKRQVYDGLPVLFTYPTKYPTNFYINGNNGMVERFTEDGILQTMRIDTYERKYLDMNNDDVCFGIVF